MIMTKPLFILFVEMGTMSSIKARQRMAEARDYLEKQIGDDFKILILPTMNGHSRVQFYPPGIDIQDFSEDLIKELAKKNIFKKYSNFNEQRKFNRKLTDFGKLFKSTA